MAYSYARLGGPDLCLFRLCGPGLGNLFFPWARFIVMTQRYGLRPIAPTWPQLKVGTIRRREKDYRFYFGLFRTPQDQISGLRKIALLSTRRKVPEDVLDDRATRGLSDERDVVVFQGLGQHFEPILRDYHVIREQLLSMTREEHKSGMRHDFRAEISVHVRLGDFSPPPAGSDVQMKTNVRLPIGWYRRVIEKLRIAVGRQVHVNVFSDGTDSELAPLLGLPDTKRMTFGSSIADLLAMTQSSVLVASSSTFSQWACYLGRMPSVWHPGALRERLYYDKPLAEVECGESDNLPDSFLQYLNLLK